MHDDASPRRSTGSWRPRDPASRPEAPDRGSLVAGAARGRMRRASEIVLLSLHARIVGADAAALGDCFCHQRLIEIVESPFHRLHVAYPLVARFLAIEV